MNFTIRHLIALSATVAILVGCALAEGNIPKTFFAALGTQKWIRSTFVMAISVVLAIGIFWLWKWANRKEGSAPGVGSGIGDGTNKGVKSEYLYRSPSTAGRLRKVSVVDAWYAIFPGWSLAFYGWMIWRIWPVGYVTTVVPPNDPHYISWQEFSVTFAAMATIAVTMIATLYVYHKRIGALSGINGVYALLALFITPIGCPLLYFSVLRR